MSNKYGRFHIVMNDTENALTELAPKPSSKMRLWEYMTKNMVPGNTIVLGQSKAAREIGVSRQQININLKDMIERKLIIQVGKDQSNNVYMLNPKKVWTGDVSMKEAAENRFFGELVREYV